MITAKKQDGIVVAEIGVGAGATSVEIVKRLRKQDSFYMFSYEEDVIGVKDDLEEIYGTDVCDIYAMGNSHKLLDSYNWSLLKLYKSSENKRLFDVVYLDGAHTFIHDGLATCILKKMIKTGGMLIFDDLDWCHAKSPTANPILRPATKENFTDEQINCCQVAEVVNMFMTDDDEWKVIKEYSNKHRVTYKRIADGD